VTRKWQSSDGTDKYTTEIVANDMQMLDSKGSGQQQGGQQHQGAPQPQNAMPQPKLDADFDDSIPF